MIYTLLLLINFSSPPPTWGFYAHSKINRLAVYSLPPELFGFYKKNIDYLTDNAVNPDKRRYIMKDEAPRHYIDLDHYSDSIRVQLPKMYWNTAVEKFGLDTLMAHGIVPWQIQKMKFQLTAAFQNKDLNDIIRLSADLGHYVADANVPLHTTSNYNGQKTNQVGIHAFWESRLPELFSDDYDLLIGQATYEKNVAKRSWTAIFNANAQLDSVLSFEKNLNLKTNEDRKYSVDERNGVVAKNYSKNYSKEYHKMLNNQIERQLKASIKMIADIWYTAWIDAGQPDLSSLNLAVVDKIEIPNATSERLLNVRKESDY